MIIRINTVINIKTNDKRRNQKDCQFYFREPSSF